MFVFDCVCVCVETEKTNKNSKYFQGENETNGKNQ